MDFFTEPVIYLISKTFEKSISPSFTFTSIMLIAWASTFQTKPQGILKKQKYAPEIIFHAYRFDHSRPLLKQIKALNN